MPRANHAFTLIELLVCVAIIALLIAILLPSLVRARERSKTVLCAANMRQMGQIIMLFSGEHDGRGPGGGQDSQSSPIPTPDPVTGQQVNVGTGVSWFEILNFETLERPVGGKSPDQNYAIQDEHSNAYSSKMLCCPNFVPSPGPALYNEPFGYNDWAAGGGGTGGGVPDWGLYGQPVYPETAGGVIHSASNASHTYYKYWYGAKLSYFRPNQFLVIEFDSGGNSTISHVSNIGSKGSVALGGGIFWPYTTAASDLSFRHPYFGKANFMFFDGHVEQFAPKDDVGSNYRYYMPGTANNP